MKKTAKIYVAGHRGMVGGAILRKLRLEGYDNIIFRTSSELDLTKQKEVEDFLYTMPGVKDVQVIAVKSPRYGEDVGAFIIPKDGYHFNTEDVRDFCKDQIARFKIPRYVFTVQEYPLTGSGKIQKFKLREMVLDMCERDGIDII